MKLSVLWLWLLDALQLAFQIHKVYFYLITNHSNQDVLADIVWSFKAQNVMENLTAATVQTSYAIRIWRLGSLSEGYAGNSLVRQALHWILVLSLLVGYTVAIVQSIQV